MAPQSEYAKMAEALQTELWRARLEYEATKAVFDRIMAEVPSGIPHPDGSFRIQKASQAHRAATQNFALALMRFSEFTLRGTLPADSPPASGED